jgi:hypothetical protein
VPAECFPKIVDGGVPIVRWQFRWIDSPTCDVLKRRPAPSPIVNVSGPNSGFDDMLNLGWNVAMDVSGGPLPERPLAIRDGERTHLTQ